MAGYLPEPIKTMWLTACCTGFRSCELVALQWQDIDFVQGTITVRHSFVQGNLATPKTRASAATVPLDVGLAQLLRSHWQRTVYQSPEDFIFAGDSGKPRWQSGLVKTFLVPAGQRAGVGRIGWHTARHTFSNLLRAGRADVKVHQGLMRHSSATISLDLYSGANSDRASARRWLESLRQFLHLLALSRFSRAGK